MAVASGFTFIAGTTPATPSSGKSKLYVDSTNGPSYVDDAGVVHSLKGATGATGATGPAGPTGNSLARPSATLSSSSGVVTVDLSSGTEVYTLTLTENVTSWNITNLPASGYVAEIRIDVIQHASSAKTVVSPATSGRTAGGTWTVSSVLSSRESLGLAITSAGNVSLYPSGVFG